jgi:hypothetical protein
MRKLTSRLAHHLLAIRTDVLFEKARPTLYHRRSVGRLSLVG